LQTIKVLLAEDHDIVREGTRQLLERSADLTVVGEAADGEEAVRLAEALQPDVIVMDVRMPRLTGLEATRLIKAKYPGVRVLILSAYEDDQYVFPLLEAGAEGYLLKTASGRELVRAIHTVYEGQKLLDPHITNKVVSHLTAKPPAYRAKEMAEGLTERELGVLRAVASGKSNKEIADALVISTYTVQVHLRNIFGKLGVGSRTEAVTFALRQGWITLDGQSP
jgi:two-component system, NarL family, response regulator LiaR